MQFIILIQTALLLVIQASLSRASPVWPRYTVSNEHLEVRSMRATMEMNPAAVTDVTCIDHSLKIVFHDENVAELGICGGIAGAGTRCEGNPETTEGQSASARFTLTAANPGSTINISKTRWDQCVRAARAICPTGSMSGTCLGGATSGDVNFVLDSPLASEL
ncbi:hypothetical protein F4778DRAFT_210379 [Xylariomycetidae sp. FL2044]|nr:hypothetical protein F4778DRAFT_210379 [Xylariomycetidae sp. FL2044]